MGTHKEWDKEVDAAESQLEQMDIRERPQRPDSRDSRASRDSRTSKDSRGSKDSRSSMEPSYDRSSSSNQMPREKKLEITSWADATYEFDQEYCNLDIRSEEDVPPYQESPVNKPQSPKEENIILEPENKPDLVADTDVIVPSGESIPEAEDASLLAPIANLMIAVEKKSKEVR